MHIRLLLGSLLCATLLALIAASPAGGSVQYSTLIGKTTLRNSQLVAMIEAANKDGTALQLFCSFMPSVWDTNGAASQGEKQNGCMTVKAQSCVNVCCYRTSSMSVCNHRKDVDFCLPYADPPTLEEMDDICDRPDYPRPSLFAWIKGGLTYSVRCG